MVFQNSVKTKNRNPRKKKGTTVSNSVTRKRKSSQKKAKQQSGSGNKMDLSERRRRARERQKRARQSENVVNFSSQPSKPVKKEKQKSGITLSFLLLVRFVILAVGVGAIAGTILAFLDTNIYLTNSPFLNTEETAKTEEKTNTASPPPPLLPLNQEIASLKQTFKSLGSEQDQLNPGAFIINLDSGEYVNLQGETTFSAASMIKLPILIAFFYAWEQGELELDERLTMTEDVRVGEAGRMQYEELGTQYVALKTATEMIRISDNTATNMIIKRIGGKEVLNQLFAEWGLEKTRIRNQLPDLEGTNTTSPKEMVELLAKLEKGELLSPRSRQQILEILKTTRTDTLLPQGLGDGATIAHKTGDIGSVVGDVGVIESANGQRYFAAMMVERPHNDRRANELIRDYSRHTYDYFETQQEDSFISQ